MSLTKYSLIATLRNHLPAFSINQDWIEASLGYPIINDLARYLCEEALCGNYDEVKRGLDFLRLCAKGGDSYTRDLVHECLDTLFSSCDQIAEMQIRFGAEIEALRRGVE